MILYHHLGLGDHFICYGLVKSLEHTKPVLLCKRHNYETVRSMYLGSDITVFPVLGDIHAGQVLSNIKDDKVMRIGFTPACETEERFGEEFYRQAGLPYETRWKYDMRSTRTHHTEIPHTFNRPVVCDTDEFHINISGVRPIGYTNLFDYISLLMMAPEIHCIESSFRQLIEFIDVKAKLYLHYFKDKSWRIVPSRHQWEVVRH